MTAEAGRAGPSLWEATARSAPSFPRLEGTLDVDAIVVGAGIVGVATAHLLKREGRRVALVELGRIGQGTTGRTTAKVTVGHGLVYRDLAEQRGPEAARTYAEANAAALAVLEEMVRRDGIDCDWEAASNYLYTIDSARIADLEAEGEAARRAGVDAVLTREAALPFPVAAALRVERQAQLHPLRLLHGLAEGIPGEGSHVFEHTRATGVRRGEPHVVETPAGEVRAPDVVLATHMPFLDGGLHFARAHPVKSYAIAATVAEEDAPAGMFLSVDRPIRSLRSAPAGPGSRTVIVGGEAGIPGEDAGERYRALDGFLREHFGVEPEHRWSAHDYVPTDGLPSIGRLARREQRIHAATGFAKWGLTKGVVAARLITDAILGRRSPAAELFDPARWPGPRGAFRLAHANAQVAGRFVGGRLGRPQDRASIEELAAGEGAVVRVGAQQYAVHRDDAGFLHVVSARCPHLGCIVGWSGADRTWECPCHGSRFAADGTLVEGPATRDLERRPLPGR